MGFSESDSSSKCGRHPNEKQHPGVCSSCLRDRLSKISHNPSSFTKNRVSVVSYISSSATTPPEKATSAAGNRHRRNGSDVCISVGSVLNNDGLNLNLNLKKSRSVSCAPLSRSRGGSSRHSSSHSNNNKIGKISDSNSNSKKFEIGGIEEKGERRMKKGGFLKRFIHSTTKKA